MCGLVIGTKIVAPTFFVAAPGRGFCRGFCGVVVTTVFVVMTVVVIAVVFVVFVVVAVATVVVLLYLPFHLCCLNAGKQSNEHREPREGNPPPKQPANELSHCASLSLVLRQNSIP